MLTRERWHFNTSKRKIKVEEKEVKKDTKENKEK